MYSFRYYSINYVAVIPTQLCLVQSLAKLASPSCAAARTFTSLLTWVLGLN